MKMKLLIKLLFIVLVLINCVCARKLAGSRTDGQTSGADKMDKTKKNSEKQANYPVTTPSSYFSSQENQNQLVRQLIDELIKNLHNKTLISKIRDLDEKNDKQLISNLTGNLENKDPMMSEYLDQRLRNYLTKVQAQSLNQTVDLMDILRQFKDIVSISSNFSLANEFELINTTELPGDLSKQDEFELIYSKNATDLTSTKLSRMEFLTDTLISLLIGKLIGLKIGFFAGKLISNVPLFSSKKQCCNTNTWPSDSPGMMPTEPTSIIHRNQFISMKTDNSDRKPVSENEKGDKVGSNKSGFSTNGNKSVNRHLKEKKRKPVKNDYDEWAENEDDDWRGIDDDEDEERSITRKPPPPPPKIKYSNNAYHYNKQAEESLDEDLDEIPNISFKQYTNYHPVYSTFGSDKNSFGSSQYPSSTVQRYSTTTVNDAPYKSASSIIYQTTRTPYQTTSTEILLPTTLRNRKHYMLLTGK